MKIFKKNKKSVTLLDEKWNVIDDNVDFNNLPRIHELIFLPKENKYYRVVNIIYNMVKPIETYVVIEIYGDDYKLIEKNNDKGVDT
tara:strand:- start:776 stop:1033 length:258 start_codon:yes stop_codon:yes gene_type:complete